MSHPQMHLANMAAARNLTLYVWLGLHALQLQPVLPPDSLNLGRDS